MDRDNPCIALLSKYGSVLCAGNPWIAQYLRDPWIALRYHTHVSSVRAAEVVMFDRKAAFEDCITKSFVQKKEQGDRSRVRKRKSWLTDLSAGEDKGDPLNGMQCFRLTHYVLFREVYK